MKKCPYCAEDIQEAAIVCKHCGHDLTGKATAAPPAVAAAPTKKKTSPITIGCLVVFVAFIGLGIVGSLLNPTPRSSGPGPFAAPAAGPVDGITMANFNRIGDGMTYNEVVAILGKPGELQASTDLAGTKTVMYTWSTNRGLTNMNAMFQNDKLVSKAQFGLK